MKKLIFAFLILFALGLNACSSGESSVEYPKTYNIVDVVSGEETEDGVVMILETDGFGGTIEAEVTVKDGEITKYEVIDHSESDGWGKTIIDDGDLTQAFVDESDELDDLEISTYLDSKASATITAEALYDIALTALEHYEEDYSE
ncbi:MAG: FMN-binding protein [Candidatus Izemoplasmatales bacterium]